jgi:hypothetical protein
MADQTRRALWLGAEKHSVDGDERENPAGIWDMSIVELMLTLMRIVCGRGVVVIDSAAAALMDLPTEHLPADRRQDPFAVQLRSNGFQIKEVDRWFHVKHREVPGPGVWFGLHEFVGLDFAPIMDGAPTDVSAALATWDKMTGQVWRGSAGDAGNAILRTMTYKEKHKQVPGDWWAWDGPEGEPIEVPYLKHQWFRHVDVPEVYGYDRVRAYLAAMTCTQVAAKPLVHDKRTAFDPKRSGWWLVELGHWDFELCMPDPAGYGEGIEGAPRVRWLTTPTVQLLHDLAKGGFYQFSILDSWTAPATPLIKNYAAELRRVWLGAREIEDPEVQRLIRAGVKGAYRVGHGYMRSRQSKVQRPDWAAAITAMSRSNLFRRLWTLWAGPDEMFTGPMPVFIYTDDVYYAHRIDPPGWQIWDGQREDLDDVTELGHWRTSKVLTRRPKKAAC